MEVKRSKERVVFLSPVRMNENELNATTTRAKELGLNRSEYVRYCIKKEMEGK